MISSDYIKFLYKVNKNILEFSKVYDRRASVLIIHKLPEYIEDISILDSLGVKVIVSPKVKDGEFHVF